MNKLKIAILSYRSAPFSGGQGIFVYELSKSLQALGHDVDVVSGPPYPSLEDSINLVKLPGLDLFSTFVFKERYKIFLSKRNKLSNDWYEFVSTLFGGFPEIKTFGSRAYDLLKSSNYDVIIDNQSVSYGMLKIQEEIPLIEIIHHPITMDYKYDVQFSKGIMQRLSKWRWFSFLKMQKRVAKQLKVISTPSMSSKKDITEDFKVSSERISVIPNGIDFNIFTPMLKINRIPKQLITTASADVPLKGLDFSLQAVAQLKDEYPDIKLVVIGDPRTDGHTERLIHDLKIEGHVSFKTNLSKSEIAYEYAHSSIAIVSSLYEGFGFPVGEAMACGIPLIASNVASIPEITSSYAQLIPSENSDAIVQSIKNVFVNPHKYNLQAEQGREHIISNFNWSKIAERYEDLILKTIKNFNVDL